jgi:16S rRNA processing protein RimM
VSPESNDFITLARIVKTQGRRGEVAAEVHSDVPDRFASGMKLFALGDSQLPREDVRRELEIEDLWPHKGLLVVKFSGIDSISDAEKLVGAELQVPRGQRAQLEPGWTYVSDLVGCKLLDHAREIGCIADVQFGAGEAPLLVVMPAELRGQECSRHTSRAEKGFEIPFAEAYLESVDLRRREVRMNLPEGMLQINAPMTDEEKRQQLAARHEGKKREKR